MKCCDLKSGDLKHKIDIERLSETPDGAGGSTVSWSVVASPWCKIKPLSGNERLQAQRVESDVTHRIYMRYRTDFTAADRINYGGRLMQIKAVINIEELDNWLELYVVEGEAT